MNAVLSFLFGHALFTHGLLLGGDIIATIIVGWGILWEAPSQSERRHRIAMWLVIWGIMAETVCSLSLFAFDEGISQAQQGKIIALESQLSPRVLTKEQSGAIWSALIGKTKTVSVMSSPDTEPAYFSAQLQEAIYEAGVAINPIGADPGGRWVGIQICLPSNEDAKDSPIWEAFSSAGLDPGKCSFDDVAESVPRDIPLIIVGERKIFWPNGEPNPPPKIRVYPELAKKPHSGTSTP